jgi:hypothetical protein
MSGNLYTYVVVTYLDDDDKRRMEEGRVCGRVQDKRTGLKGLKEATDIPTECKVVAEKDLLDFRRGSFSKYGRRTRLEIAVLNKTRSVSS